MADEIAIRSYLIFTGTGPILVLSTYADLADERLTEKLRYKGIEKFIAYQVDLDAVERRYGQAFDQVLGDLLGVEDIRVLDFNGHHIMASFYKLHIRMASNIACPTSN